MTQPACSFVSLAGRPATTGADTAAGALVWQPRHSSSSTRRRRRPSRRCPVSAWTRISAAAASNSNSAASCSEDGAIASADSRSAGAQDDGGRVASAEAAKAAAAAAVADMFLQLDASLEEDQLMVVGASASPGATEDGEHDRGTTTTSVKRGTSVSNHVRGAHRDDST
ncbi:unnamed protein product, partial [Laminaria digitata]